MTTTGEHIHRVIIALGTNIDHNRNMLRAMSLLQELISVVRCTEPIFTEPVGMVSDRFLNTLVAGRCALCLNDLQSEVKRIERECGRNNEEQDSGVVRMDIDIMEYDGRRLHVADWNREYIKQLIKKL